MEQMFDPRDLAQELSLGLPSALSCTLDGVCSYLMELGDFPHLILDIWKLKESRLLPLPLQEKGRSRASMMHLNCPYCLARPRQEAFRNLYFSTNQRVPVK